VPCCYPCLGPSVDVVYQVKLDYLSGIIEHLSHINYGNALLLALAIDHIDGLSRHGSAQLPHQHGQIRAGIFEIFYRIVRGGLPVAEVLVDLFDGPAHGEDIPVHLGTSPTLLRECI